MNMTNTIYHENFIMTRSLVYRLGYCEAIVLITLGYQKAIILLQFHYQCMNHYIHKYEFLFHIFLFLMSSVNNTYNIYSVFYHIRLDLGTGRRFIL